MSLSSPPPRAEGEPASEAQGTRAVSIRALTGLAFVILLLWSGWAYAYHSSHISAVLRSSTVGSLARLVLWIVPCSVYLIARYGAHWSAPIGLGFPYGLQQIVRSILTTVLVSALLIFGTALQLGTSATELARSLFEHAKPHLQAPIFEEVVFRGVIASEALTWATQSSKTLAQLRRRFWLSQLGSSLVFVLVHWPYYLLTKSPEELLRLSLGLGVTGLVLGFSFAQTRSVYVCIFLHWLNNELSGLGAGLVLP